jgi:uncharacterized repeat protein (TIGR01451 family)
LIPPSIALVTITDDISGLSFSSPAYSKAETGGSAAISVFRSNYTNSTVSVDFATANGTGQAGVNYFPTNGTLIFTNGETVKTFAVQLKDNGVVDGDHTVLLSLANPVGNAVLINPSAATLTVLEADGSLVVPAGAALTSESGPVNGFIDPNETVTLLFGLRDSVGTNTANLVATLLATNGVSNPSAPANYGVLVAHGPSVSRPFTFTASGTNGQTITATFQLQDGSANLGQATFRFTLGKTLATFSNPAAIVINDNTSATPYPSTINVNGIGGLVTGATVTLTNLNHTWPSDIDILLVSPTGQNSYLMAKCGSSFTTKNVTLTFDDAASSSLPQFSQIVSGTNKPTSHALATPPFPAALTPPPPYNVGLSNLFENNPNGNWSLYVIDDTAGNSGAISNGWILNLTTGGVVPPSADVGLAMTVSPPPIVTTSNVTFTLTVTNYGPSSATNIVVTDTLPMGTTLMGTTASQGIVTTNGSGQVVWTITSLTYGASATLSLVVRANVTGVISNAATVATDTTGPNSPSYNPGDKSASASATVVAPSADLALSLVGAPDPVLLGNYLTYTITISNGGPATAAGLTLVDQLPPGASFVSATPAGYIVAGQLVTFPNLGNLGSGLLTTATIVVQPTAAATITNTASCSSSITDPFKANNSASVKTIVQQVAITASRVSGGLSLSWPGSPGSYVLYSTTNLHPPVVWTPVTVPSQSLAPGGGTTIVVPIGPGNQFFRLNWSSVPTLPLSLSRAGANLVVAWPVNQWNCKLESTTNLHPPVVWTPVTTPSPQVSGGQNAVTIPIGSGGKFFRLHGTTP